MQIKCLHKNFYKLYSYARPQQSLDFYRMKISEPVKLWEKLKEEGNSDAFCAEITGISRATFYRRRKVLKRLDEGIHPPSKRPLKLNKPKWGEAEKQLVLRIRRENPTYGKDKIGLILRRDHKLSISDSTVGRILNHLKEKGLVLKSMSAPRKRKKRIFGNGHASPWAYKKYKDMKPGERVQIDHMTVTKNGVRIKHFQAWERKSKHLSAQVYDSATSRSAKRFLEELIKEIPYKLRSIQVDGGSEFMGAFETACKELDIPLMVLPPSKPAYNGGVERSNRTLREEFYGRNDIFAESITEFRTELKKALQKYNSYRPHHALKGLTPMEYIELNIPEAELSQIT